MRTSFSSRFALISWSVSALALTPAYPASAQETAPIIVRKSGGVLQESADRRVEPTYPPLAKAARITGSVVVEVLVDEQGNVSAARAISGHPLLKDAAVSAARGWKFKPTLLAGSPVRVIGTLTFNFDLGSAATKEDADKLHNQAEEDIAEARKAVETDPNDAEAHFDLAEAYAAAKRYDDAIQSYTEAIRLKPDYKEAHQSLAETYHTLKQYDEEISTLKMSLEAFPNAVELLEQLRTALSNQKRNTEAIEVARQLVRLGPDDPRAQMELARLLYHAARYEEALTSCQQVQRLLSSVPERRDEKQGIKNVESFLDDTNSTGEVLFLIGASNYMLRRYSDALTAYEQALQLYPAYQPSRVQLEIASTLLEMGRSVDAIEAMKKALKIDPMSSEAYFLLGQACHDVDRHQEAVNALQSGLALSPGDEHSLILLVDSYCRLGNSAESEKVSRELIRIHPNSGAGNLGLAIALENQHKFAEAEAPLRKALELLPGNVNGLSMLGDLLIQQGKRVEAEVYYRKALDIQPDNPSLLNKLGYSMVERGENLQEALTMIEQAVKTQPGNGNFIDSLGWAYFKLGKLDQAERYLTEAARIEASSAAIQEHLGDLYQREGKVAEASAAWQKALSLEPAAEQTSRLKAKLAAEEKKQNR